MGLPNHWGEGLLIPLPSSLGTSPGRHSSASPLSGLHCTLSMPLLHGILSYNSVGGKPNLYCSGYHCLEGCLSQKYMLMPPAAVEEITTGINVFLGTQEACTRPAMGTWAAQ